MKRNKRTKQNVVEHVTKEGSRKHVIHWDTQGRHCSEPNCEINQEPKQPPTPKVGDKIYVPSSMSISHGSDDFAGGRATVKKVYKSMSGGDANCLFVDIMEGDRGYNWTQIIGPEQAKLKKEYGNRVAHPDPDIDTPWLEAGDSYSHFNPRTGKTESGIYKGPPQW